jgi:hypothetical protein
MTEYKKFNNIIGWLVFLLASVVYILTCEPTTSFWDCGEYISTAYKLQVGHPPGAPFFQLLGRFFSLFAFGDTSLVAFTINVMSALCSSATILFLFWTITAFGRKIVLVRGEMNRGNMLAVMGAGLVGSLAYAFSDSFWFSAVEGEVYAMSSLFTAVVFWAIMKWEEKADEQHADRWLIFIAFLVGLSIGVHLLNLLAIPAITFVYYFKRFKTTRKGLVITSIVAVGLLGIVQSIIIPQVVNLLGKFELFFTNSLGLPFDVGAIFYALVLTAAIVFGLQYTIRKGKVFANTMILCFTFIIIGYSSFMMLVIRSQANTPIDENNPEDAISLLSYLNREQYGTWPVLYGQYFNAPLDRNEPYKDGSPVYKRSYIVMDGEKQVKVFDRGRDAKKFIDSTGNKYTLSKKYLVTDDRKQSIPNYDEKYCTIFPRMWSAGQANEYKQWVDIKGKVVDGKTLIGTDGTPVPSFGENLSFFFKYQLNYMWFRYFMWNFSGRQNDIQGHKEVIYGNWITGIPFIDKSLVGEQDGLPEALKNNKGRNVYYMLPFLLGIIGLIYHYRSHRKDMLVVGLLFLLTGIAIQVYLNVYAYQPRERDYAYVGSFYAFAIWIGLGAMALIDFASRYTKRTTAAIAVTAATLVLVPGIMAKENWDDHDRSGRYTALDFACNYLNSCAPNAILFTNGDNDTFPLWYAQEVEGVRTDVRVVNLSLLNTDWYIDQMKRKAYDSDPVPFSMENAQYRQGTRDYVYIFDETDDLDPSVKAIIRNAKNQILEKKVYPVVLSILQKGNVATIREDLASVVADTSVSRPRRKHPLRH